MPLSFHAYYIHPAGDRTGSFGVLPDDLPNVDAWQREHGYHSQRASVRHSDFQEPLYALRPIEENSREMRRIREEGIQDGDLCLVTYEIKPHGSCS